jgi:dTDP-4-amino-4,6-dideoxygalactose transaminase
MITNSRSVPFVDLITLHSALEEELVTVFRSALASASFIGGSMVSEFEKEFASYCDTAYCVGVGSGTDALRFSLMAAGVNHGDIVLTVPNTFIATTEAITQAGGVPDFVDIDERTYNMDAAQLLDYLTTKCEIDAKTGKPVHQESRRPVTALIPVHLYGQMADMDPIIEIAERFGLIVIEDACQAHGAQYFSKRRSRWMTAGSMGRAAAFSFYPGKNLGACGEAGAVTTDDEKIARTIRMVRDHGQGRKYVHDMEGYNGRLDAIQAGILRIKLKHLPEWNERRRQIAERYNRLLRDIDGVTTPSEPEWVKSVYHLYVIRATRREELQQRLSERHIATGLHYPVPLHLQQAYVDLGYKKGDFPTTEKVASEILSLPMYPGLTEEQQEWVAQCLKR